MEGDEGVGEVGGGEVCFIFSRYFAFLFWFLLWLEGLSFFFVLVVAWASFFWVAREKEKEVPSVREKVKMLFWLASTWQKSIHFCCRHFGNFSELEKHFPVRGNLSPGVSQSPSSLPPLRDHSQIMSATKGGGVGKC